MADNFGSYAMKGFDALNRSVLRNLAGLESKEIDNTVGNLLKIDNNFKEMEDKIDKTINILINNKIIYKMEEEINEIK